MTLNVCMVGHGMMGIWHSEALRNMEECRLHTVVGRPKKPETESATPTVGRKPASGLVKGQLELDEGGYVIAGESTGTSIPGVYAVGDVRTKQLRQIVTAVADGANAVESAQGWLLTQ